MTPSAPAKAKHPGTTQRASLFLIAAMAAVTIMQLWSGYRSELAHADELVSSVSKAIEQQISGSIRSIDNLLSAAAIAADPGIWPQDRLTAELGSRIAAFPEVLYIGIANAQGMLHARTIPAHQTAGEPMNIADRQYFIEQQKNYSKNLLHIGSPGIGSVTGEPIIHMSRPILGPRGEFRGIVVAAVDSTYFARFLESVLIEKEGAAAVIHADGTMLARAPAHREKFGKWIGDSLLFTRDIPKQPSGVGHFVAKTDGNDKILGYRSLGRYPLVVTSGITRDTALRNWRHQTYLSSMVLLGFSLALYILASISDRREHRRMQAVAGLEGHSTELEALAAQRTSDLAAARHQAEQRAHSLARSHGELKRFAEIAAHHLQEPLRPIVSYAQMLEKRYCSRLDEDARDFIGYIVSGSLHMKRLLGDFQHYVALSADETPHRAVALGDCVKRAKNALAEEIRSSQAIVTCEDLPVASGDAAQLDLLFHHLLQNAIQYRSPSRPLAIHITAKREGGLWHVTVRDNGAGIEPQYLGRIFGMFERLNTGSMPNGTGIGLAICRKIAERHQGRIWADSQPGQGSRFHLTLPAPAAGDVASHRKSETVA